MFDKNLRDITLHHYLLYVLNIYKSSIPSSYVELKPLRLNDTEHRNK